MNTASVREPAVAGRFYPDDAAALRGTVERLLAEAAPPADGPPPRAIIAPHAGYAYSGPVAASAYASLAPLAGRVRRAVVIGPSHFVALDGLAAPSSVAFATPLGLLPIDRAAIDALSALPQMDLSDAAHREEHAIEVQLPFLQAVLPGCRIVPLVVGDAGPAEVAQVLARLWAAEDTVLVVSSDLSHYENYETARRHDLRTAGAIERLDETRLGPYEACGCRAIAGLLVEARRRGLRPRRLDLRNSGDTAAPRHSVVGYGAWAFADRP